MRLAARINRLEKKQGAHGRKHTRFATIKVDSRYPEDQLNQFITENGLDDPCCLLVIHSIVTTNDADEIIEPCVMSETPWSKVGSDRQSRATDHTGMAALQTKR